MALSSTPAPTSTAHRHRKSTSPEIRPNDARDFGTSLPGTLIGLEGKVRVVYLAMVLGWTGAPGNYMMLALAARDLHECYRPAEPRWHDEVHFRSEWLMDDPVVVETDLGERAWLACDAVDSAIREAFSGAAVNESKREAEGQPQSTQIIWGLTSGVVRELVGLPEREAMKMRCLPSEPELRLGPQHQDEDGARVQRIGAVLSGRPYLLCGG